MKEQVNAEQAQEIMKCPHCGGQMDLSGIRPFTRVICPVCKQSLRVRDRMGVYQILDCIGKGGMSEIYRARDTILGRVVALKILNEDYSTDQERVSRFEEEARIMAKVRHQNIVQVYTVGRAYGYMFIAMELVDGRDLETQMKLRDEPMPEPEVLDIAIQTVEGLEAADKAGLVHRDIKPANILMDTSGICKIVDFGLSLLKTTRDESEAVWVTPYYASPEALRREVEDFRSDMYALGVTLFQMLTGKPPFKRVPTSIHALLEIKRKLPSIFRVNSHLSPKTCMVVDKMMQFKLSKRYETYEDLKQDLIEARNELLAGGSDWETHRAKLVQTYKIKRYATLTGVGVLVTGIVTGIGAMVGAPEEPLPPSSQQVLPEKTPKTIHVMSREEVGQEYQQAEEQLYLGNLEEAVRCFERLTEEHTCPLTTAAWSSLNAAYACWIQGDIPHGNFLLEKMANNIANQKKQLREQDTSVVLMELMQKLLRTDVTIWDREAILQYEERMQVYVCVGVLLRAWQEKDARLAYGMLTQLEQLGHQDEEIQQQGTVARSWLVLMRGYVHDIRAIHALEQLPDETLGEAKEKLNILLNDGHRSQSPGSTYKDILYAMRPTMEARIKELEIQEKEAQELRRQQREEELHRREQEQELERRQQELQKKDEYAKILRMIEESWNFPEARQRFSRLIREVGRNDRQLMASCQAYDEMAEYADEFLTNTLGDFLKVAGERDRIWRDENQDLYRIVDWNPQTRQISVERNSRTASISVQKIGVNKLIEWHQRCMRSTFSRSLMLKRHWMAIVFVYIAGDRERAEETMEKWQRLNSNSFEADTYYRLWKKWMKCLKSEKQEDLHNDKQRQVPQDEYADDQNEMF